MSDNVLLTSIWLLPLIGAVVVLLGLGALAEGGRFVDLIPRIQERLR